MPGKLDEISAAIGEIRANVSELRRARNEDKETGEQRHRENRRDIAELKGKIDATAATVASLRAGGPAVLPRSRIALYASIGLGTLIVAGWIVEAAIKWAATAVLSHWH